MAVEAWIDLRELAGRLANRSLKGRTEATVQSDDAARPHPSDTRMRADHPRPGHADVGDCLAFSFTTTGSQIGVP